MNRIWAGFFLSILLLGIAPVPVQAANLPILNPNFEIVPNPKEHDSSCAEEAPLSYGAVLQLIQNLMNASISVALLIMIVVIIYAGVLFLVSPTNPGNREMGRTILANAVIGFVIVLAAWILIDFLMKALYQPSAPIGSKTQLGPWNEILSGKNDDWCIKGKTMKPLYDGSPLGAGSNLDVLANNSEGGGSCEIPTNENNPCSLSNIKNTCFKDRPEYGSKICMKESMGGKTDIESGSDRLDSGKGKSYSIGLWQLNLTVHKVGGLPCPDAFTKPCDRKAGTLIGDTGNCTSSIRSDQIDLYNRCVAAAKVPANNWEFACDLYKTRGFQPWTRSAQRCQVPLP